MKQIIDELDAVHRAVGRRAVPGGEARTVVLRRTYPAPVEDVWDAITNPERLHRWFLPVTGDFRLGGSYQLQGNAGGEVVHCEPPHRLTVTWVYGEKASESDLSEVEVRLSGAGGDQTVLELEHAVTIDRHWEEYGPGAVGVGWDLTLLGLSAHLRGESIDDPEERAALGSSPEGRQFMAASSRAWGAAYAAGGATEAQVASAVENTTTFYVPPTGDQAEV